jgi:hypothetical protein
MSETRLADVVRRQFALLDDLFAGGAYEIVDSAPLACDLRAEWVEVALAYDSRDAWVIAQLKPLTVPDNISDSYPDHSWLGFCGIDVGVRRKSALDDQQVIDELNLIRPIVELFKNSQICQRRILVRARLFACIHGLGQWQLGLS